MRAADDELMSEFSPGGGASYGRGIEAELEAALEEEFETGLGGAFEAQRELVGVDTRVEVTNPLAAPFRYICNLEYDGWAMCSGTLIGPRTVLTAGHCPARQSPLRTRNRLQCGTRQFRSYDRTVRISGGMLLYVNDTCPGHSGSPVWVRRHPSMGGRVLIGIHVAPAGSGANRAVLINRAIMSFIVANTI